MRSLRNIRVSQSKAEWSDRNRYQPIRGRVCQVLKNSVIHNHESLQQWDKGYCTYAWTPKLVIYNSMSDIQWYSQRRGFEVYIWLPLYWSPVDSKLLAVIRSWWIPRHIQSRQTAIRYYFRLAGLRGGEEEDWIKELQRIKKCIPSVYLNHPPMDFLDLIWWLIHFDLTVQRKGSITRTKWENNCAAQHRLWSIHLDTTWLAGRGRNNAVRNGSDVNKGDVWGASVGQHECLSHQLWLL